MSDVRSFQRALRAHLSAQADAARAKQMQAYMKSAMPYSGATLPDVRRFARAQGKALEFSDFAAFDRFVRALWREATHREERYVALELLDVKPTRRFHTPEAVPLYEFLITDGAWWDLVDTVATHRYLPLLEGWPRETRALLRRYSRGPHLWLRRTAIISQVLRHDATDTTLLFDVCEPALAEKEFFLRKAIGWGLRSAARWKPREVRAWLTAHAPRLSGLSRREAEKGFQAPRRES